MSCCFPSVEILSEKPCLKLRFSSASCVSDTDPSVFFSQYVSCGVTELKLSYTLTNKKKKNIIETRSTKALRHIAAEWDNFSYPVE